MVLRDKDMKNMQDLEKTSKVFRVRWENELGISAKEMLNPLKHYLQMGVRYRLSSEVGTR